MPSILHPVPCPSCKGTFLHARRCQHKGKHFVYLHLITHAEAFVHRERHLRDEEARMHLEVVQVPYKREEFRA